MIWTLLEFISRIIHKIKQKFTNKFFKTSWAEQGHTQNFLRNSQCYFNSDLLWDSRQIGWWWWLGV